MDPITQGLLGAATAQLGFRQRIGRDATWVAAAAAIVPDLDVFVAPLLSLTGMEMDGMARLRFHRGLSHSLLMAPLLSLPIAALWWRLRRRPEKPEAEQLRRAPPADFPLLYLCVFVAVFTHPLLDWCTSYGTQLLAPLRDVRYAIDAAPIIDLIYTPLLVLTLLACYAARTAARVRAARATLRAQRARRGPDPAAAAVAGTPKRLSPKPTKRITLVIGWSGFLLSVAYLAAGRLLHDRAVAKAVTLVGREKVLQADAYPAMGSILLWRAVVETDTAWHAVRVHQLSKAPPNQWKHTRAAKLGPNEWINRARELPEYKTYDWFAGHRLRCEYQQVDGVHVVRFHDMRYSRRNDGLESLWPLVVEFDADGRVLFVGRRMELRATRFGEHAAAVWHDLWNP